MNNINNISNNNLLHRYIILPTNLTTHIIEKSKQSQYPNCYKLLARVFVG